MSEPFLPAIVTTLIKVGLPAAVRQYQAAQAQVAEAALLRAVSKGKTWAISDDKAAAAIWRYQRAMMEGAARRNLELLAEALVNFAADPEFVPNDFLRHADALASLSREEVLVVASFMRARRLLGDQASVPQLWEEAIAAGKRYGFRDEADFEAHAAPLARTGWLVPDSGFSFFGYRVGPAFSTIERIVDWDDAADREAEGADLHPGDGGAPSPA